MSGDFCFRMLALKKRKLDCLFTSYLDKTMLRVCAVS
jgi:hypothetical protein